MHYAIKIEARVTRTSSPIHTPVPSLYPCNQISTICYQRVGRRAYLGSALHVYITVLALSLSLSLSFTLSRHFFLSLLARSLFLSRAFDLLTGSLVNRFAPCAVVITRGTNDRQFSIAFYYSLRARARRVFIVSARRWKSIGGTQQYGMFSFG